MSAPEDTLIWGALPIPAILLDGEDHVLDLNPAAEAFLNTSTRAAQGQPLWQRMSTDTPIAPAVARARASQTPLFVNEINISAGLRAPLQCDLHLAPMAGGAGHLLLLVSPRELAGRLGRSQSTKSAAKSAIGMAEMLAHEIKNPLAGIIGAAQLLAMNLSQADTELTDLIVAESRRIVKLLEQVEQFGNLRPPQSARVNLHDVLDRARRSALLGFGAAMQIIEEYDPSLPDAQGDADQLVQVVLNLLKNAAEAAGPGGGTIRLRSFYEHSFRLSRSAEGGIALPLQIEISDDGPGLPPEIAADVFDPFVSGRENGTGLGLALASKIIADHGGWISVTSKPGETVFRLSLARAPALQKEPR